MRVIRCERMNPLRTYDYLALVRTRLFDSVRPLSNEQYRREFPFGLKTIGSTMAHLMISEWFYIERMQGRTVPPYDQWPIQYETPPAFDVIQSTWTSQTSRVREAIAGERDWNRTIRYVTFPDDKGRRFEITTSPSDIITQLSLHEMHHRAQVMAMLRMTPGATPVEDVDFNDLMYQRREITA